LLDSIPIPISYKDKHQRYLGCNQTFETTFNARREELIGKTVYDRVPDDLAREYDKQDRVLLEDPGTQIHKTFVPFPDGSLRNVEFHKATLYDENRNVAGLITVALDTTEREERERALSQAKIAADEASRSKSDFIATVSHELRTPLNAIIGFSTVMKDRIFGGLDEPAYKDYPSHIVSSGEHLLALINDLLDLSKIEAGKFELLDSVLDVAAVIEASLRLARPQMQAQRIGLEVEIEPGLPSLKADETAVKQVLANILSNAVKFSSRESKVSIAAYANGAGGVTVAIRDHGIGIPEHMLPRIFEPFEQADGPYTAQTEGTGLGLAISKDLMVAHGGTL